jgi:hypothetical protein
MRISVDEKDPAFGNYAPYTNFIIKLDGKIVKLCITADDELGEVSYYETDHKGNLVLAHEDEPKRITRNGKVEILLDADK